MYRVHKCLSKMRPSRAHVATAQSLAVSVVVGIDSHSGTELYSLLRSCNNTKPTVTPLFTTHHVMSFQVSKCHFELWYNTRFPLFTLNIEFIFNTETWEDILKDSHFSICFQEQKNQKHSVQSHPYYLKLR